MSVSLVMSTNAQLSNGSTAPDFDLVDIYGDSHHLYGYLAEGKTVFIEFFACHCPSCWNYHNSGRLDSLNQLYGPNGTDQIVVLMLEYDEYNGLPEFYGTAGWTAGNWVAGNSIPMINVEWPNRSVFDDYDLVYFTQIYKICTDRTTELMYSSQYVADLYQAADNCPGELVLEEIEVSGTVHVDYVTNQLVLMGFNDLKSVMITNSMGQSLMQVKAGEGQLIDVSGLKTGMYFVQIEYDDSVILKKVYIK